MKTFVRNSGVVAAPLDDEIVLMSTEGNRYFSLNSLGGRIWELLEEPRTRTDLVNVILAEYEVDERQADLDVKEFLERLESRKLILAQ